MLNYIIGSLLTLSVVFSVLWVVAVLGKTLLQFLLEPISMILRYFNR